MDKIDGEHAAENLLRQLHLEPGEEYPCPYLGEDGRMARDTGFVTSFLPHGCYQALMDRGFRRSGRYFYRPSCKSCGECRQMRIPVGNFSPTKSQKECLRKNRSTTVSFQKPEPDAQRFALYERYMNSRHRELDKEEGYQQFLAFLYQSPIETVEAVYRINKEIVAIGIFDVEPKALSAVYCYFDPAYEKQSMGLFNMLTAIEYCRGNKLSFFYVGFYVAGCRKMDYKARLGGAEVLQDQERWNTFGETS